MSFRYTKAARSVRGLTCPQKSVLRELAWYADSGRPGDAFPSVPTLAGDCALTQRCVREKLRELEAIGLIEVAIGAGAGGTNSYTLRLDRMETIPPEPCSGEEPCSGVRNHVPAPPEPRSSNTVVDSKIPPRTPSGSSPPTPIAGGSQPVEPVLQLEPVETPGPAPPATRRKRRTPMPEAFEPSIADRQWAAAEAAAAGVAIDLDAETERFKSRNLAKDERYAEWDHAWRNWLRNALKFAKRDAGDTRRTGGIASVDERRSRLVASAARRGTI